MTTGEAARAVMDAAASSGGSRGTSLILEGFRPVSESIEWRIADLYWARRGAKAFLGGDVPHLSTNDGMYASRAAELLFASCLTANEQVELEPAITVLELGVGIGLHARLLLDRFQAICRLSGTDFYDRLTYFATDASPKMLGDLEASGTLQAHAGHVRLGRVDALNPSSVTLQGRESELQLRDVRGVFCNYLLDVLPYDVLLREHGRWFRLHLRTVVHQAAGPGEDLEGGDLADEMTATSPSAEALLDLQERFDPERAFFPVEVDTLPFGEWLPEYADEVNRRRGGRSGGHEPIFVHSHGALKALDGTLLMLRHDGFVLCNDYGSSEAGARWDNHQRYGGSRAVAVNFSLLDFLLSRTSSTKPLVHIPPGDGEINIHSRLLSLKPLSGLQQTFAVRYDTAIFQELSGLIEEARRVLRQDAPAARSLYKQAHDRFPENWAVLTEWSQFEVFIGGDKQLGLTLAQEAVKINPTGCGSVYDVLGDALVAAGMRDEAYGAYREALRFDSQDIRAHAGLGWVYALRGDHDQGISAISTALTLDRSGSHRQVLVGKLNEILSHRDEWAKSRSPAD